MLASQCEERTFCLNYKKVCLKIPYKWKINRIITFFPKVPNSGTLVCCYKKQHLLFLFRFISLCSFCPSTPLAKVISELHFQPSRHEHYISLDLAGLPGPNRVVRGLCELQWPRLLSPSPHCLCVPSPPLLWWGNGSFILGLSAVLCCLMCGMVKNKPFVYTSWRKYPVSEAWSLMQGGEEC